MAWYYNSSSGKITEESEWIAYAELHLGLAWHGPFDTEQDAENYYTQNKGNNPGWKAPTTSLSKALTTQANPLNAFGLNDQNLQSWMIRIGEILLGIVLLGVGIAKLTGTTNLVASAVKAKI